MTDVSKKEAGNKSDVAEISKVMNPNVPWQRVPNQKRIRSPGEITMAETNNAKRVQLKNKKANAHRTIRQECVSTNIDTSNSFSMLDTDVEDSSAKPQTSKPPPIILYGIENLGKLKELIEEVVEKNDYTIRVAQKNNLILSSKAADKYKILIQHIRNKGLIGYTFTPKDQKCTRIVIKHLHFSTPKEAIVEAIEKTGNTVQREIINARRPGTKEPLNTFFVNLAPHENNKLAKDIKFIFNQKVAIEDPKRQNTIVQCKRCQRYGHSKNNCMRPYRCVKCAGEHKTTMCTLDDNTPAICTLCSGNHPASYKGCEVYREILARKNNVKKSPNATQNQNNIVSTKIVSRARDSKVTNTQKRVNEHADGKPCISQAYRRYPNEQPSQLYSDALTGRTLKTQDRGSTLSTKAIDPAYVAQPTKERTILNLDVDNNQHQSTYPMDKNPLDEQNARLEQLIMIQSERIDQLITQLSTMMNLITTLMSKLP